MAAEFFAWFLMAVSMATILIAPLLSDGPPELPSRPPQRPDRLP
jgi:hypothetical protein